MALRILFVTGTSTGGAARSTDELGARLERRGHEVAALAGWRPRPRKDQLVPTRRRAAAHRVAASIRLARSHLPFPPQPVRGSSYPTWRSRSPEGCLPLVCSQFRPDVVVVSAVGSPAWRAIRSALIRSRTPCAMYLRNEGAVNRLAQAPLPELVIANAFAHAELVRLLGVEPVVTIPSVVETEACQVDSTRERALFVNPIGRRGLSVVLGIARERPAVPITIQESAPLDAHDLARLRAAVAPLPNVELRRWVADPRDLYRDARVLLIPYQTSNRPRVVLEAQSNGIPVLSSDLPGLQECVGPGGLLVDPTAPPPVWAEALDQLWDGPGGRHAGYAAAALRHSRRPEVDPEVIVDSFEAEMMQLAGRPVGR
jgi:glycosyltransferase involved in cell wall biosynthesis